MTLQYRLLGRLETGELAELYRAERDDQKVVIKLFHPRTSDVAYAQTVAETQRLLTNVMHPGVSHVLDIGLVKHRLAVVREDSGRFNLGTALQRLNTKEVLLALPLALTWVIDLLDVVQQAHEAGVVHGALTPGNVMLTPEGRPAVCDFGALAALNASPALKKNFGARGRNNYRAPEVSQADAVSVQSDLYSLGAITYELLTLREPSSGSGAAQMSVRREAVPPPSRLDRRINSRLDPIILRAIEQAPSRRYRSCADFADALRDFLSHNGGLPQREDLKRFINELFPKEVNADAMGPVPFAERFALAEVSGAELQENDERSMVVMARKAFSGGEADHTAETSEALPQFEAFAGPQEKTDVGRKETEEIEQPGQRSDLSWDAPPSAQPVARKAEVAVNNAAVMKRLKVMEDFEQLPPKNDTIEVAAVEPKPRPPARAAVITTPDAKEQGYAATPAESQQIDEQKVRDADGKLRRMITEERNIEAARKQRAKMMGLAGTFLVFGFVIFAAAVWMRREGLLPGGPTKTTRVPQLPPKPAPNPDPPPRPPPQKTAEPAPKPQPKVDCYDPPAKKGAALLTVVPKKGGFKYDLDGALLCDLDNVAVKPGTHKLGIIDTKAGTRETVVLKLEAGRHKKINP